MRNLSDCTSQFAASMIRRMTLISQKYNAINLSQGFPDFDPPKAVLERLAEVALRGPHQYCLTAGAKNFRQALAEKQSRFTGLKIDPETQICVTCGSTEANFAAFNTLLNPGDKVAMFSPYYEAYKSAAILCHVEPIFIPLNPPEFSFDPEQVEDAFRQGAKVLIVCSPSNPCGKVFTMDEMKIISELAIKYDAYIIADDAYEHIVYEPYKHIYMATLPGMEERTLTVSSLSKSYSMTGWRIGYIISTPRIIETALKVHGVTTACTTSPLQEAAITALQLGDDYYRELQTMYTEKKNILLNGLNEYGISYSESHGAFYVMADISEFGYKSDREFCDALAEKIGVGAVPGSGFFSDQNQNYMRLHFAKKNETLYEALDRLSNIKKLMKK